jgi:hypothetical protein
MGGELMAPIGLSIKFTMARANIHTLFIYFSSKG